MKKALAINIKYHRNLATLGIHTHFTNSHNFLASSVSFVVWTCTHADKHTRGRHLKISALLSIAGGQAAEGHFT